MACGGQEFARIQADIEVANGYKACNDASASDPEMDSIWRVKMGEDRTYELPAC